MYKEEKEFEITSKKIKEEDEKNKKLMELIMKKMEQEKNKINKK